ncbi:MAG: hypothetical protein H0T45_15515 [Pyrinomonadaceae bacterium]|nr:hypothetical protein [Pyrinomonadaceae bacterium]
MAENETALGATTGSGGDAGETTTSAEAAPPAATPDQEQAAAVPDQEQAAAVPPEEITYHAVEKDGQVTAIWEMQGRKHLRTIDPRSRQGQEILRLYTAEHITEAP